MNNTEQMPALFVGSFTHSLDAKRRMIFPSSWRNLAGESNQLFAFPHPDQKCLYLYTAAEMMRRIEELREQRIEGTQTVGEFMDRRLTPAVRTCEAVAERIDRLSSRVARASDLLRTRVDIEVETQNQKLLSSMERRARLQLRLQQTVEGLSVAAISYYLVGRVAYLAKAAKSRGLPIDPDLIAGLAVPAVLLIVWLGVKRIRRKVAGARDWVAGKG